MCRARVVPARPAQSTTRPPRSNHDTITRYSRSSVVTDTPSLLSETLDAAPELPGPYPVGEYAAALREQLRGFARVQLVGEIANLRPPTRARAYFELRDADGAIAVRDVARRLGPPRRADRESLADGAAGGRRAAAVTTTRAARAPRRRSASRSPRCGWPARATCSRRSSSAAARSTPTGCSSVSAALPRPLLPRTIGVVCGEGGRHAKTFSRRSRAAAGPVGRLGVRAGPGSPCRAAIGAARASWPRAARST